MACHGVWALPLDVHIHPWMYKLASSPSQICWSIYATKWTGVQMARENCVPGIHCKGIRVHALANIQILGNCVLMYM